MFPVATRTQERVSPEQLFRYQKVRTAGIEVRKTLSFLADTESRKKSDYT